MTEMSQFGRLTADDPRWYVAMLPLTLASLVTGLLFLGQGIARPRAL
ncbi:hypothetical protein AAEX63_10365 [Luteococcus sp. H138]